MLTTRALKWLGRTLRLIVRDAAYFTLVVGFLFALPVVFRDTEHVQPLMAAMRIDSPMVAYLANVGGLAILLGNLVCTFAVIDAVMRILMIPMVNNIVWLFRNRADI